MDTWNGRDRPFSRDLRTCFPGAVNPFESIRLPTRLESLLFASGLAAITHAQGFGLVCVIVSRPFKGNTRKSVQPCGISFHVDRFNSIGEASIRDIVRDS